MATTSFVNINNHMDEEIAKILGLTVFKPTRQTSSGCISTGTVYKTENGKLFVKKNAKEGAEIMFRGEYESLKSLEAAKFPVPKPLLAGKNYLVMEYLDIMALRNYTAELGRHLAKLHLSPTPTDQFGFDCDTSCGFIPMDNTWSRDWLLFFTSQRLKPHIDALIEKHGDRELLELWGQLQIVIPNFFKGITVKSSLLHGDLWLGNTGETETGPLAFDPASFYGHAEFDLAMPHLFGGFSRDFFRAYHSELPKQRNFTERNDLYKLFHNLNHWSHFGEGYREASFKLMRGLIQVGGL